jgi:hypothetical protein
MQPLPAHFRRESFDFTLIERSGAVAIYRQSKQGQHWESFAIGIVHREPAYSRFGKDYPAKESFPSDSQWGVKAWSCNTLARARERAQATLTRLSNQNSPPTAPGHSQSHPDNGLNGV